MSEFSYFSAFTKAAGEESPTGFVSIIQSEQNSEKEGEGIKIPHNILEEWYLTLDKCAFAREPHRIDDLLDLRDEIYAYLR